MISRHARDSRRAVLVVAAALGAAAALAAAPGGAATPTSVKVWFLQGEQLVALQRPGSTQQEAVQALLAGPTPAETRRGVRSYVPAGTPLRAVSVANGVATVDLGEKFVAGRDAQSLLARLSQVVHTATGPEGATKVRLLIKGGTPLGLFPGAFTAGPITVAYLETPDTPTPKPPSGTTPPVLESVGAAQERLVELGYLLPGDVDGQAGPATQVAVLAFQKWEGLDRDGVLGPQTLGRLQGATRPSPITRGGPGKRAEVLLDRQVALAIEGNRVVRVIHVSTGAPPRRRLPETSRCTRRSRNGGRSRSGSGSSGRCRSTAASARRAAGRRDDRAAAANVADRIPGRAPCAALNVKAGRTRTRLATRSRCD